MPRRLTSASVLCLLFGFSAAQADPVIKVAEIKRNTPVDFEKEVLPLLKKNCLACHNTTEKEGKLILETPQTILKGGDSGPGVVPKKGAESLIILRATGAQDDIMPPKDNKVAAKNFTPEELGLIKLWIDQGATGTVSKAVETIQWQPLPASVNPIYAVALTTDGQFAACGRANQIFIYHVPTGRTVCRLTDPELLKSGIYKQPGVADLDIIQSLAFSADGLTLASGGFRTAKIWQRPRNVREQQFAGAGPGGVQSLAVSADGKLIATVGNDHAIKVWDRASAKPVASLAGHSANVTSLRFAADGKSLVSGSLDKSVRIWKLPEGTPAGRIDTPSPVNAVTLVAGGTQIATGGADNKIRIWTTPAAATRQVPVTGSITATAVSPDRKLLAVAEANNQVRVIDLATGKDVKALAGHGGAVTSISFQADGKRLATVSADKTARVWDIAAGQVVVTLDPATPADKPATFTMVALHPTGNQAIAGFSDGSLKVYKLDPAKAPAPMPEAVKPEEKPLPNHAQAITAVIYKQDGAQVFTGSADGNVRGYQVSDRKQLFSSNNAGPVHALALSADGKWLARAGEDKFVRVLNPQNGQAAPKAGQLGGFAAAVKSVAFTGDNLRVVGGADKEVIAFNIATGEPEQAFNEHTGPVIGLSSAGEKGELVVSIGANQGASIWAIAAGAQLVGHTKPVTSLDTLASAPTQIISGSEDGNLTHWETNGAKQIRQFKHNGPITAVAARADGERFASAGADKLAKLWNAKDGKELATMKGDLRAANHVLAMERMVAQAKNDITAEKAEVAEAEKNVTTENEGVKKATEAKAAAEKTLGEKVAAAKKPVEEKAAAEKALTEATAKVKPAEEAKAAAEKALADADAALKSAKEKAAADKAASEKEKDNKALADAKAASEKAATEADMKQKKAAEAKAAADKALADASAAVKQKTTERDGKVKPADDAEKAVKDAEVAKASADRALVSANNAAKKATDRVPLAKADLAKAEEKLKKAEADLATSKTAATATESPWKTIAFSADGLELATGGDDKLVHTWSGDTGAALEVFEGHTGPIAGVAYTPDRRLVSASADTNVSVWDTLPLWTWVRTIGSAGDNALVDRVTSLDFSPDGKLLATGGGAPSRSGELKIWNVADGKLVREITEAHSDTVLGLKFSPDGQYLASCGADKFMKIFNVADGKFVRSFEGHTHHVLGVAWQGDGKILATAGADNAVKVWDFKSGEQKRSIAGATKEVTSIVFVGDTPNVVATSGDKSVRLVRTDNGQNVRTYSGAADFMYSGASTVDGKVVVAGGQDSVLRVWNGDNGQTIRNFDPPAAENATAAK
jgi:WD40 repeat protein